jgi:tetratricopeptide (TPR) repeat protein
MKVTKDTAPIDVAIAWAAVGSWVASGQAAPVGSEQEIQLQPGDWLEWRASVRREDSGSWTRGNYECAIDMASALRTLSSDGRSWRGRAVTEGKLTIQIADGTTLAARKAERAEQAARSLADGQPQAAVGHYQAMVQADPTDRAGYAGLGLALVAARQFKEAVAALEVALPSAIQEKSSIPETLAYAYVAIGDQANAARVLRMVVPESQVTARLDRLRTAARRSAR